MRVETLFQTYKESKPGLKADTIESFRAAVKCFCDGIEGDREIRDIELDDVIRFKHTTASRVSSTSYNTYLNTLKVLFRFGVRHGHVSADHPIFALRWAKVPKRPPPMVSDRTLESAISYLDEEGNTLRPRWFWKSIILVLAYTGMRRRQLTELVWGDLDMKNWVIHLPARTSKSGKPWDIPVPAQLQAVFEDLAQRTRQVTQSAALDPSARVFSLHIFSIRQMVPLNPEMKPAYVTLALNRLSKRIKEAVSPHKLRHAAATRWMNATGHCTAIQQILGHSKPSLTFDYVHPDLDAARTALLSLK